jgi:hypothetical protein
MRLVGEGEGGRRGCRRKKKPPKRVLALPDLEQPNVGAPNSLNSGSGQRMCHHAVTDADRCDLRRSELSGSSRCSTGTGRRARRGCACTRRCKDTARLYSVSVNSLPERELASHGARCGMNQVAGKKTGSIGHGHVPAQLLDLHDVRLPAAHNRRQAIQIHREHAAANGARCLRAPLRG